MSLKMDPRRSSYLFPVKTGDVHVDANMTVTADRVHEDDSPP